MKKTFTVVALITVRNEELYLDRCIRHLVSQGVYVCIIDNDSTDNTKAIAESFLGKGVIRVERFPYPGHFDWSGILKKKEKLAQEITADWFIHYDADEIREAPKPYKTLLEGIQEADRQGYNAINFDEFVFLPTDDYESYEATDYVKEMQYYYFFEPKPLHRLNAWKSGDFKVDLHSSGGHRVEFEELKIFPFPFILRHYIGLSKKHLIDKYVSRPYSPEEVDKLGWHRKRASFSPEKLVL